MVDKLILDFENNTITIENEHQKGTEFDSTLKEKKQAVLAALGYETIDFSSAINKINKFVNGELTEDEFLTLIQEETE